THPYTLSLHDALPIYYQFFNPRTSELNGVSVFEFDRETHTLTSRAYASRAEFLPGETRGAEEPLWALSDGWYRQFSDRKAVEGRSEEHTSELQSRENL